MSTAQPTYEDILRLFQETDRQLKETDRQLKETALLLREKSLETDRKFQETDHQLKELGKQIGGLGSKFGSFTEGLALPSMEAILQQRFGMTVVTPRVRARQKGAHLEIDVLAYANGDINRAFLVEVKSHPREEAIAQLRTTLSRFREFFPEHRDKQLYGILAAVDWSEAVKAQAIAEGLYVARIHDDV
ncbi:MAG: DUF3782 domain-containing protein, partial [Cyanobacteria bacterium REEB459]|nr:DUF3782 domain-containing protein [Cyanobacteria bacterium REEB459]